MRCAIRSFTVMTRSPWRFAKRFSSGSRAIEPSGFVISQMTPTGASPAIRQRSTAASVCPARTSTPTSRDWSGKMWPGFTRSCALVRGSASTRIVRARSAALIPVVTPSRASTLTVNAVPSRASLRATICGSASSSRRAVVIGTQITPLAYLRMNATCSGSQSSAAIVRSPSFSRSSSSTTMTMRPRLMSSIASGTVANGAGVTTLGRGVGLVRRGFISLSLEVASRLSEGAAHVLREYVGFEVDELPGTQRSQSRPLGGMWDERDLEERLAQRGDRERDAVDGDETLVHHVAGLVGGESEPQPCRPAALLFACEQLGRRVDVALHEVTAERRRRRRGALEVHACTAHRPPQRRASERLRDEIHGKPARVALDDRQAGPSHVHAGVHRQALDHGRR